MDNFEARIALLVCNMADNPPKPQSAAAAALLIYNGISGVSPAMRPQPVVTSSIPERTAAHSPDTGKTISMAASIEKMITYPPIITSISNECIITASTTDDRGTSSGVEDTGEAVGVYSVLSVLQNNIR